MVLSTTTPAGVGATTLPSLRQLTISTLLLLLGLPLLAVDSVPPQTATIGTTHTFVINGALGEVDKSTYTAQLVDGSSLPSWIELDSNSGTLSYRAPSSARGQQYTITITATTGGSRTSTELVLNVVDPGASCGVDANTDRLGRLLDCKTGKTQLRGFTSTGDYRWTGPDDFTSSQAEPTVSKAGIYRLTGGGCNVVSLVEVLDKDLGCSAGSGDNVVPEARITTSTSSGAGPLTVRLNGSKSGDADGKIIEYLWSWADGAAVGSQPTVIFAPGEYEVVLTVTDNTGARSTDRQTIVVEEPSAVTNDPAGKDYWLEAECADVGAKWTTRTSTAAAAGSYVVVKQGNATQSAPADKPENHVRFTLNAEAGNYKLFARIDAPSNLDDSYWVRINDGGWYRWSSGIEQDRGFEWNKYPKTVQLTDGDNTIDFAYREDGARLDKLYLTKGRQQPSSKGSTAGNCDGTTKQPVTQAEVWMEAECATVGSGWERGSSSGASSGTFVAFPGKSRMASAPNSVDEQVQFSIEVSSAGTYHLFLRLDTPDLGANSFWVRIDNGNWVRFYQEIGGASLKTQGFQWRQVNHDGRATDFELDAGTHTITVANREAGTKLDKLYLSQDDELPSGHGEEAENCKSASAKRIGMLTTPETTTPEADLLAGPMLELFPNPTVDVLNVRLSSDYEGRVLLFVTDASGRQVRQLHYDKVGERLSERISVDQLPAGMYYLRVIEGKRQSVKPFVKRR